MSKFAWVTLTTNDTYSLGALVLAHSLRRAGTKHELAVLVTPGVSESMRHKLKDVYNIVQEVNIMDSQDTANLALLARPELGITFTKLHCWRLTQFEKCVFLDADTLVLQNCDELFEREEFSAAPDVSWPDCFNSGVFVYKPSQETFDKIVDHGIKNGSFDGGDQGLLNQYFSDWATSDVTRRLPFVYNVTAYASYCYLPAFKQFRDKIKILHFAGKMKPWLIHYNSQSQTPSIPSDYAHASDLIQLWWNIFFDHVHQLLNDHMRYSLTSIEPWKCNYDTTALQLQQQQHEQYVQQQLQQEYATNLLYNLQYDMYQEQYTNHKIEFHDPWEDYYRKQETNAEIQNDLVTAGVINGNENMQQHYHDDVLVLDAGNTNSNFIQESNIDYQIEKHNETIAETTTAVSSCDCDVVATVVDSDDTKNDSIESDVVVIEIIKETNKIQVENPSFEILSLDLTPLNSRIELNNKMPELNDNNTSASDKSVCDGIDEIVEEVKTLNN